MRLLAIETSCDETAAAVVEDGRRILSSVVSTQAELHAPYGGVVPELASRHHLQNIVPVIERALRDAGLGLPELDAVAVTQGPGLIGSLLVGVQAAKGLAYVHRKPLVPVHHIAGHIQAPFLSATEPAPARAGAGGRAASPCPAPGGSGIFEASCLATSWGVSGRWSRSSSGRPSSSSSSAGSRPATPSRSSLAMWATP